CPPGDTSAVNLRLPHQGWPAFRTRERRLLFGLRADACFTGSQGSAFTTTMGLAVLSALPGMHIDRQDTVTLRAPGRLHLGFLDPSASLGRRFGSIGVVIEGFETEIELSAALADRVTADTVEGDAQIERASA